ncbi:MAG: YiiD C-terminal domain-containing protein [Moraxellaceae bacterium]
MTQDFLPAAQELASRIHEQIPLTAAMQLSAQSFDGKTLVLAAPLTPNINDKGTAFAGSITALGNVTGWCLLTLWSERVFGVNQCRVAIFDAQFSFKKPLTGDFSASVSLPSDEECAALKAAIENGKNGKITLQIVLADTAGVAVKLTGSYAVWKQAPA